MRVVPPLRVAGPASWAAIRRAKLATARPAALRLHQVHDLLYVASDLRQILIPASLAWQHRQRLDLVEDGHAYRYLRGSWYSWLHHRVRAAETLSLAGRMPAPALAQLLAAWGPIRAWAYEHLPARQIQLAETTHPAGGYPLPSAA